MVYLASFTHTKARVTLLKMSKHEISVARQIGKIHFGTLKSLIKRYSEKKVRGNHTILFRVAHHFFKEIAPKSHTILQKYESGEHRRGPPKTRTAAVAIEIFRVTSPNPRQ